MIKVGNVLRNRVTTQHYVVTLIAESVLETVGYDGIEVSIPTVSLDSFEVYDSILDAIPIESALDTQHGGDHYKKLGDYQPWQVLKTWLTPEEFRGYMKGTAIAYLAREVEKGGDLDVNKATHTLQAFLEMK